MGIAAGEAERAVKRCRFSGCRQPFTPRFRTTEVCCSPEHAIAYAREASPKKREVDRRRVANAERKERRMALKRRKDWIREAQAVFNAMIRERDYFKPCISCGVRTVTAVIGGGWDAGHFRSVGAAPELRFTSNNVHKQCKSCNSGVIRKGSRVLVAHDAERYATIHAQYRVNLIERIGLEQVEWLEGPHEPLKLTVVDLQESIAQWRADTRRMRAQREARAA